MLTSEAHISKTDGVLVFLTTLGIGALARLYIRQDNDKRMVILFWVAMGLGGLIKGPVTPMVAAFVLAVLFVWDRRNWDWMKVLLWWPGPVIGLIIFVPWLIWIQMATAGQYIEGAVGKDLKDKLVSASEGHGGLPGYHLVHIPAWFFPGSLLFVPMIVLTWRELKSKALNLRQGLTSLEDVASGPVVHAEDGRDDVVQGLKFLVAWAVPTWLFFELLLTKLSHYILPAYPAFGLLCGYAAVQMMAGARVPVSRGLSVFIYVLGGGALLAVSTPWGAQLIMAEAAGDFKSVEAETVLQSWAPYLNVPLELWAVGAVAFGLSVVAFCIRRLGAGISLGILASVLVGWHARTVFLPNQTWVQATETARLALEEVCGVPGGTCEGQSAPAMIQAVGYAEPSYVMTLGTQNLHPPETNVALPQDPSGYPAVFLINMEDEAGPLALETLTEAAHSTHGCVTQSAPYYALNYSNGDPVDFIALRIDEAPCA